MMNAPNSNENGLLSDFEGDKLQPQAQHDVFNSERVDYAINGQCPQCFNQVETHCYDVLNGGIETGLGECFDFCKVCRWEGNLYYE